MSNPQQLRLFDDETAIRSTGSSRCHVGNFFENCTANLSGAYRLKTDSRIAVCPDLRLPYSIKPNGCGVNERTVDQRLRQEIIERRLWSCTTSRGLAFDARRGDLGLGERYVGVARPPRRQPPTQPETFIECKAAGRGNQVILYRNRVKKEADWAEQFGYTYLYFIWCHNASVVSAPTVEELYRRLLAGTTSLIVSTHDVIHRIAQSRRLRKVNNGIPKTKTEGAFRSSPFRVTVKDYGIGWTVPTSLIRQECQVLDFSPLFPGTAFQKAIQVFFSYTIPYHQIIRIFTE